MRNHTHDAVCYTHTRSIEAVDHTYIRSKSYIHLYKYICTHTQDAVHHTYTRRIEAVDHACIRSVSYIHLYTYIRTHTPDAVHHTYTRSIEAVDHTYKCSSIYIHTNTYKWPHSHAHVLRWLTPLHPHHHHHTSASKKPKTNVPHAYPVLLHDKNVTDTFFCQKCIRFFLSKNRTNFFVPHTNPFLITWQKCDNFFGYMISIHTYIHVENIHTCMHIYIHTHSMSP